MSKPKIRFEGFADDWEQRKLIDEVASIDTGKSKFVPCDSGEYEILGSTSVIGYDNSYDYEGDFLLTARVGANAGELYRHSGKVKISDNTVFIQGNYLDFIYYALLNFDIKKLSFGTGQPLVKASELKGQNIRMPVSMKERKYIGNYFKALDNLITLHQRKCDEIKKLKKYMLQNMFPQEGEKTPKIRFDEFTDDWEQRKFGKIVKTRRGLTYKPSDIRENGIRVLRSSNINEDRFILKDDDIFVSKQSVNIDFVKENDILITAANGSSKLVGKHAILSNIANNSTVHGGFMLIASTTEPHFINAYMGASWYKKFINLYVAGGNGAIGNLNKNDLGNQEILIPSEYEQKKIGLYFSQLDNLITLHQRKCDELKEMKKFMLQNMFV